MNNKTIPIQMRELIARVRDGNYVVNEEHNKTGKNLNMRDMLKITRMLNEELENKKNAYDQDIEEEKFRNNFKDINVNIKYIPLEVYNDYVFWGGTVDGIIQFAYKVTDNEATSGVEFNYLPDFSPDNAENDEIIKRIESYYNTFYKYWQNNLLQK